MKTLLLQWRLSVPAEDKSEEEYLMFDEPVEFETEREALAFCSGLGYGTIEGVPVEQFPLRSFEEYDMPFIEAIENY